MRGCRSFGIATASGALNGNATGRMVERCGSFWPRWCSWGCSWGGASARRWRGCFRPSWGRSRTRGGSRAWFTGPALTGRQGRATVPCAGRSPGLASTPPSTRSALTGASRGSRSWSASAREGAAGSLFRKRGGGVCRRALTVRDRPGLRGRRIFWDSPPGPAFGSARGGIPQGWVSACGGEVFLYHFFRGGSR